MNTVHKWFTLIEMLIVIVIIGILAAALIPRIIWIQASARDVARTKDMSNLQIATVMYFNDNWFLPSSSCNNPLGCWKWVGLESSHFSWWMLNELVPDYITTPLQDPLHPHQGYTYVIVEGDNITGHYILNAVKERCDAPNVQYFAQVLYKSESQSRKNRYRVCPNGLSRDSSIFPEDPVLGTNWYVMYNWSSIIFKNGE